MAHPVPDEGDTVEVAHKGTTERGTVAEAAGHHAVVELGDDETVEARHADQPIEGKPTYTIPEDGAAADGDEPTDEEDEVTDEEVEVEAEAPEAEEAAEVGLDPDEYTVEELADAVEDITDEQTLIDAIAIEEEEQARSTALESLEDRLEELQAEEA